MLFHFDTDDSSGASIPINETGNGIYGDVGTRPETAVMSAAAAKFGAAGLWTSKTDTSISEISALQNIPIVKQVNATSAVSDGYTIEYFFRCSQPCRLFHNSSNIATIVNLESTDSVRIGVAVGGQGGTVVHIQNTTTSQDQSRIFYDTDTNLSELPLNANTWAHIAVVLTTDWDIIIYVNGTLYVEHSREELLDTNGSITSLPTAIFGGSSMLFLAQPVITFDTTVTEYEISFDEFRVSAGRKYNGNSYIVPTEPFTIASTAAQTTLLEVAMDDGPEISDAAMSTMSEITGSYEVKFAGNFVSNASTTGGGGTTKAIAYPLMLKMDQYDGPLHLEIQYSKNSNYSSVTQLINTKTTPSDRQYVLGDGGSSFEQCPSTGFAYEIFGGASIMVNMEKLGTLNGFYYLRYRWLSNTSDTSVSDWYRTIYPAYTDI